MKTIQLFMTIIIFSCLGCGKQKLDTKTLSGHLYKDCSETPVKNQALYLFQRVNSGTGPSGKLAECTTDSTGYFTFDYQESSGENLVIKYTNTGGSALEIRATDYGNKLENLKAYYYPTCKIIVRLNVTRPYTSADTLFANDMRNITGTVKLAGPFIDGQILYIVPSFGMLTPTLNYSIYKQGYWINNPTSIQYVDLNAKPCIDNIVTFAVK